MVPGPMLAVQPALARRAPPGKSSVLAGALEWLVPGVGLMYGGGGCAGAFVLVATLGPTLVLLLYGLALAGARTRPVVVNRYFLFLGLMYFMWLLLRTLWAALTAQRYNETHPAPPPARTPYTPYTGASTGSAYSRPPAGQ
jgi:hypothetical protein